jgi:hypothetical protein
MDLGLNDGEFVTEVVELIILSSVVFDFCSRIPIVEVGDGASECMVCGGGAIEKGVELNW